MNKFKQSVLSEILLSGAIIIALVLLLNPFNFLMTSALTLTLIMILAVAVIAFGVFVWREAPRDEREVLHSMQANRLAAFAGAGVLVVAIIVQAVRHELDIWLALTLGAMVVTKLITSAWNRHR